MQLNYCPDDATESDIPNPNPLPGPLSQNYAAAGQSTATKFNRTEHSNQANAFMQSSQLPMNFSALQQQQYEWSKSQFPSNDNSSFAAPAPTLTQGQGMVHHSSFTPHLPGARFTGAESNYGASLETFQGPQESLTFTMGQRNDHLQMNTAYGNPFAPNQSGAMFSTNTASENNFGIPFQMSFGSSQAGLGQTYLMGDYNQMTLPSGDTSSFAFASSADQSIGVPKEAGLADSLQLRQMQHRIEQTNAMMAMGNTQSPSNPYAQGMFMGNNPHEVNRNFSSASASAMQAAAHQGVSDAAEGQETLLQKMLQSQLASLNRLGVSGRTAAWTRIAPNQQPQWAPSNLYPPPIHPNEENSTAKALAQSVLLSQMIPAETRRAGVKRKNKPKRPLTAYNLFFKEERAKMVAAQEDEEEYNHTSDGTKRKRRKTPHGKIGFEEMARTIAQKWKEIDPEVLAKYEERAEEGKRRYREEIDLYLREERKQLEEEDAMYKRPANSNNQGT